MFIILKFFARFNATIKEYIQIFYKKVLLIINKHLILHLAIGITVLCTLSGL